MKILINQSTKLLVENIKNKKMYSIEPNVVKENIIQDARKIADICNQHLIYETLFKEMLSGNKYTDDNAKGFINWSSEGWNNQSYFVFLIRDSYGNIVGSIDIKSNNLDETEIGYWLDKNHSGVMTNSIRIIIALGKQVGFKKYIADVKPENIQSIKILENNDFKYVDEIDGYLRYERKI